MSVSQSRSRGGDLAVANSVKIGYGESDTSGASYDLDVSGDAAVNNIYLSNAIYHAEDTDTYFQFHNTSNQARIVCNGSEVMEWGNNYAKMNDWDSLYLGSGSDFRLYHDGTNNYIRNMNHAAGDIYIQGEDTSGVNHTIAAFYSSNAAPYVGLRYDNTEVFTTVSGGVNINGDLNAVDNIYVATNIYHEGDTDTKIDFGTNTINLRAGNQHEVQIAQSGMFLINSALHEDYDALSGTTPSVDPNAGGAWSLTLSGNTTFTFGAPIVTGKHSRLCNLHFVLVTRT